MNANLDVNGRTTDGPMRVAVGLVYFAALLQGLTLVSFPAVGSILKQSLGFTDAQYGAIFLPQVVFAVLGSVAGGTLSARYGLRRLLGWALAFNALSQLLLAGSSIVAPELAFYTILGGTASLGFGFGLAGAPLNSYPASLFPRHTGTAVVALHTLLGLGLTLGPIAVSGLTLAGRWTLYPLLTAILCAGAALLSVAVTLPETASETVEDQGPQVRPIRSISFWMFVLIVVMYAFAEGTFSNWAVIFLSEGRGLPESTAVLAVSVFWGALVVGRLAVSALVLRVAAQTIWLVLPLLMVAAFLLLPLAEGPWLGVGLFGLAGLASSAFFPLTITLVSRAFPAQVPWVSSMMIAALMLGVGLGSFVIGPLLGFLSFERLYQWSALYPAVALIVGALLVRRGVCGDRSHTVWKGSRCL